MSLELKKIENLYEKEITTVREYIVRFTANDFPYSQVSDVIEDATRPGGKMLRSRLLLLCASFGPDFDQNIDRLHRASAAIELTHMASLIHDDIVDDAVLRRGEPSIQAKYGKDAAVYAGDFILSRVVYCLYDEISPEIGKAFAKTVEAMCLGEINQKLCRYDEKVLPERYLDIIHGKTAELFMLACRTGAALGGCTQEVVDALGQVGEHIGLLFQLRDDLLDYLSSDDDAGKKVHVDFSQGIYTYPVIAASRKSGGNSALLALMRTNRERKLNEKELEKLQTLIEQCGGISDTKELIKQHVDAVKQIAERSLPCNQKAKLLMAAVEELGNV